jgi:hypothetical protein
LLMKYSNSILSRCAQKLHRSRAGNQRSYTSCLIAPDDPTRSAKVKQRSETVSREERGSVKGCCARDSRREAPRWSVASAVVMALLDREASSCRSICAYRSADRGRRSSSAASSRFSPTRGRSFQRWMDGDDRSNMSLPGRSGRSRAGSGVEGIDVAPPLATAVNLRTAIR